MPTQNNILNLPFSKIVKKNVDKKFFKVMNCQIMKHQKIKCQKIFHKT